MGHMQLAVIPITPCQKNGSVLWCEQTRAAGSSGRTDFPRGDHATLIRSIRERLGNPDVSDAAVRAVPRH
jgi:hypothetical protein